MPVYEYVCNNCNDRFDRLVRNLDAARDVSCVRCDSANVRRVVSGFAMVGGAAEPLAARPASSGGCCGGSCGCGGHA